MEDNEVLKCANFISPSCVISYRVNVQIKAISAIIFSLYINCLHEKIIFMKAQVKPWLSSFTSVIAKGALHSPVC